MGRKIKYRFSGKTKDGKSVVAGCFTMYDSTDGYMVSGFFAINYITCCTLYGG
jgi:hypothetical protein